MRFKQFFICLSVLAFSIPVFAASAPYIQQKPVNTVTKMPVVQLSSAQAISVSPLSLVSDPNKYLNRTVIMNGKFDKFSTLGLDYKKAFRDSNKYIGFMLQREDVKDHNIPLSELKLFIARTYAEKFIDLNTGDKIKITGKVFSTALGDPWVDIDKIEIIEKTAVKTK